MDITPLPTTQVTFVTPQRYAQEQAQRIESPRGALLVASCRSGDDLAGQVVARYKANLIVGGAEGEVVPLAHIDDQFSDGETCARLAIDVSGEDVFLFQALYDPTSSRSVDQNYMAFLIAARALREWGANHVTGIVPYLVYARQDKPTTSVREPTTAKLMADLAIEAGIDRLTTWHAHSAPIKGFYGDVPIDMLESTLFFVDEFKRFQGCPDVIIVAPDAGASKLVTSVGRILQLNCAIASKYRPRPEVATVSEVIGDFRQKKKAVVLDDIISTGGTIYALTRMLVEDKGIEEIYLGVSHNLCMSTARARLEELHSGFGLRQVTVTDSVPQTAEFQALPFVAVRHLSHILSQVVNRIHYNRSLGDIVYESG